jgi:hypothetical protein
VVAGKPVSSILHDRPRRKRKRRKRN